MITGGSGGSNTLTGLAFEGKVDFQKWLSSIEGYRVAPSEKSAGVEVFFDDTLVARCFRKHDLYKFLKENAVDWKEILSKKLLPDDAIVVTASKTLFVIEVKYQQVAGSVDEKLQTCDFKRRQYVKLVSALGLHVEYVYVLNNWFKKPEYQDVLDYIEHVNCHYQFGGLPISWLGLPTRASALPS